jgi:squalene-associated FAD-dependent desaturase
MTGPGTVHIVGAGVAGLSAAVELAARNRRVQLYEAGRYAGGRCRSYLDAELGCRIDNGNHLLLAGNRAALRYLARVGAIGTLERHWDAAFPFVDADTGERWIVRPNRGALPWWISSTRRRVPGTRAAEYLAVLRLRRASPSTTVTDLLDRELPLFRRLWEPLAVAALNTGAEAASARLFWRVLAETLGRGAAACRPLLPRDGLSETFVDPALAWLRAQGAHIRFGARLRALHFHANRVSALLFDTGPIELGPGDSLILAVPAMVAARLAPALRVPDHYSPIVNAHFRCASPAEAAPIIGVIGGTAQWIFRKGEVLSVTVSAADEIVDRLAEELGELLWRDVALAHHLPAQPVPPVRIVKERRATFLASPEQLSRRPRTKTRWANFLLAGDYVDTGLPATIEGAVASGIAAAHQALAPALASPERARGSSLCDAARTEGELERALQ